MRMGAFELNEPIPELREPHVLAILRPWIDVNNVGTSILDGLEAHFATKNWLNWLNLVIFSISPATAPRFI